MRTHTSRPQRSESTPSASARPSLAAAGATPCAWSSDGPFLLSAARPSLRLGHEQAGEGDAHVTLPLGPRDEHFKGIADLLERGGVLERLVKEEGVGDGAVLAVPFADGAQLTRGDVDHAGAHDASRRLDIAA